MLVQGYAGPKEQEKQIPADSRTSLQEAGERLVQLCEVWGKPDQANEWRRKLEAEEKLKLE